MNKTRSIFLSILVAAAASPAAAQTPQHLPTPPLPAIAAVPAMPAIGSMPSMRPLPTPWVAAGRDADDQADDLYDRARDLIEQGRFDRAVADLDRLIGLKSSRTDAAMYWKAYSLSKLGQRAEALAALNDLYKQFADSRWIRDAKALEVEVRQASGQAVSPASQDDDELKLMALRGIMQSDPDQALPVLEKMLSGTNSPKVKDRALFVLSQSHSARAREIIGGVARGNANPDLQLRAIRYIGIMGGPDNRQILADVYKSSNDPAVKRSILRSFMTANDRERLFAAAKTETDASLRGEAIRQLGVLHASSELQQLYQSETSRRAEEVHSSGDVRRRRQRQADRAREEREGSGAAQDRHSEPRSDEARRHELKRSPESTRRTRRSTSRRRSSTRCSSRATRPDWSASLAPRRTWS